MIGVGFLVDWSSEHNLYDIILTWNPVGQALQLRLRAGDAPVAPAAFGDLTFSEQKESQERILESCGGRRQHLQSDKHTILSAEGYSMPSRKA